MTPDYRIKCLIPDLPEPDALMPLLREMQENRWYSNFGPLNRRFEAEMASFLDLENISPDYAVATFSSATTGLELALKALDLAPGARVLVPALTFPATALAAMNVGLTPVLADVDTDTWELMPEAALEAHAHAPLAAVMPVAAFGKPVPGKGWVDFKRQTGVPVIVDAAASLGQQGIEEELIYVFSLHATKPFGVGEGGLMVCFDREFVERAKSLSNFGFQGPSGVVQRPGTNAKLAEYFAAVGLLQVGRWQEVRDRRMQVFDWYAEVLRPLGNHIRLQAGTGDFIPAVFPIHIEGKAAALIEACDRAGIQTRRWYLPTLQNHPALSHLTDAFGRQNPEFAVADGLADSLVGLPFHAFLSKTDIADIGDVIAQVVRGQ